MSKELLTLLLEAIELLALAVGSALVSGVGILLESRAVDALFGGDPTVGAWFLFMGAVALYFGVYLLGYGELLPRLRRLGSGA